MLALIIGLLTIILVLTRSNDIGLVKALDWMLERITISWNGHTLFVVFNDFDGIV